MTNYTRKNNYVEKILKDTSIQSGERNAKLIEIGGTLKSKGFNDEETETILRLVNERRCIDPLSDKELEAKVLSQVNKYSVGADVFNDNTTHITSSFIKPKLKIQVVLHNEEYLAKPNDTYKIQNDFISNDLTTSLTLEELKEALEHGKTTNQTNGYYVTKISENKKNNKRINTTQQVYYLDVDNDKDTILSLEEAKEIALKSKIKPFMIYESFSSTPEKPRFRIAYVFNKPYDLEKNGTILHKKLKDLINEPFKNYIDSSVTNDNRLIFGTNKSAYYFDDENINDLDNLLELAQNFEPNQEETPTAKEDKETFLNWISEPIENKVVKTGIEKLDRLIGGGLPIGISQVMGESSLGKTAFALNVAEELAKTGRKVLYFTTEMDKNTLYARGISRESKTLGYSDIILGKHNESDKFKNAVNSYFSSVNDNLIFIECFSASTKTTQYINSIIAKNCIGNVKPVAIIDYLQQLDSENAKTNEERIKIKNVSTELLDISNKYKIPVVVLSSVARENYGQRLNVGSGKESGELEFNATNIMALQWTKAYNFNLTDKKKLTAEDIDNEKRKPYREVTLSVLKNRLTSGTGCIKCCFNARINNFIFDEYDYNNYDENFRPNEALNTQEDRRTAFKNRFNKKTA